MDVTAPYCNDEYGYVFEEPINSISSIWAQLGSLSLLIASASMDTLLMRYALVIGNAFIFLQGVLGSPLFPCIQNLPFISLDTLIWGFFTCLLNTFCLIRLLLDEREIKFSSDMDLALWRLFFRRTGVPKLNFKEEILSPGSYVLCKKGYKFTEKDINEHLYLIVEGIVKVNRDIEGIMLPEVMFLSSGDIFDIGNGNLLGLKIGFGGNLFDVTACSDCVLFSWPTEDLKAIGEESGATRDAFRSFLTYSVAKVAQDSVLNRLPKTVVEVSGKRSEDFDEFRAGEGPPKKDKSFKATMKWIWDSLSFYPPLGSRKELHVPHRNLENKNAVAMQ